MDLSIVYTNHTNMKKLYILLMLLISSSTMLIGQSLTGAWEHRENSTVESRIYAGTFFSVSLYSPDTKEFLGTFGGTYEVKDGKLLERIEFDTRQPDRIGTEVSHGLIAVKNGKTLTIDGVTLNRVDDGKPGDLSGAWLITGRVNDKGETRRSTPGARRTMKILSGTRFQWIAYNVDTKEFFGTGGGTYTTVNGKYTENIGFFSRDNSRVGASLTFDYSFTDGEWHHSGLSSKGEPLHEIWTRREKVGI